MIEEMEKILSQAEDLKEAKASFELGFISEIQLQVDAQMYYFQYRNKDECLADFRDLKNYLKTHQ